jgi:hypothetical protein
MPPTARSYGPRRPGVNGARAAAHAGYRSRDQAATLAIEVPRRRSPLHTPFCVWSDVMRVITDARFLGRVSVMRWIRRHLSYANVVASIALFLAMTGGAYAVVGNPFVGANGAISVCVQPSNHLLSVVKPGHKCPKHDIALTVNEQGQRGSVGSRGATGPPGPAGISTGVSTTSGTSVPLTQGSTLATVMTSPAVATAGQYYVNASVMLVVAQGDTVACITAVNGGTTGPFATIGPASNQTYETLPLADDVSVPAGDTVSVQCTDYTSNSATSFYDGAITATLIGSDNAPASASRNTGESLTRPPAIR